MNKNVNLVLDVDQNPKKVSHWILFAFQHILAMLVACITVPMITGLPIGATLISAGLGTIIYILVTRKKSPVFLSSSFAYLPSMLSALTVGVTQSVLDRFTNDKGELMVGDLSAAGEGNYLAVIIGMAIVGLIYVIIALIIKAVGTKWINKLLPPVVIGPVIMVIGLGLAGSAVNNVNSVAVEGGSALVSIAIALVAVFLTALAAHFGKKTISLIPFVIGMGGAYLVALVLTLIGKAAGVDALRVIDFAPLKNLDFKSISGYLNTDFMFVRAAEQTPKFDLAAFLSVIIIFAPVALVTICEHIGDHKNLGNIIGKDLINGEPGLTRTLIGDGVATAVSGAVCGAANTTYGENVAVVGVSRNASVNVILLAAILSVALGFIAPLTALLATIPACITGGVSLILYGFIASSGVKMLVKEKVDFSVTKNIIVASVILVTGIGGLSLQLGSAVITSTAMSMILGILLNFALVEKKEKNAENAEAKEEVSENK